MGITVNRPVKVRVIVTEEFKRRRGAEIRAALAKLEAVKKRIDYQLDSLKSGDAGDERKAGLIERLNRELGRSERARGALVREMDNLASVQIGAECEGGALQSVVEVDVGDDFAKLAECEIVVKDNKIVEIRDGLCKT